MRVAYFEAWNLDRPCLTMDVTQIDTSQYTHIHFAFANITSSFAIDISGAQDQFDGFKALTGVKRILSFGGWDFSTAPGTFNIFREATKVANRAKFGSNIVAFVKAHSLDGVDLDWEYPGVSQTTRLNPLCHANANLLLSIYRLPIFPTSLLGTPMLAKTFIRL